MLAELTRCRKRKHASIIASGERALAGAVEQDEAFKGVSEFNRIWYHDIAKHTIYDLAHALANQVKDTIRYSMVHTSAHLTIHNLGRFASRIQTMYVLNSGRKVS